MKQDDEITKRLVQGREAKQLLENPLMVSFFSSHIAACQKAFRNLPMGCPMEQYQTVQHDLLAIERLRNSIETYMRQAEVDVFNQRRAEDLPEDIEV